MSLEETALRYLEICYETINARVDSGADPLNEEKAYYAMILGEKSETVRRELGDAIIEKSPELKERVRLVCKFPADKPSQGFINRGATQ